MGTKKVVVDQVSEDQIVQTEEVVRNVCSVCKGTGRHLPEQTCPTCEGTGQRK